MDIEEIKEKITPILKKSGVKYAGVFGSVARGQARQNSDVDILVGFIGRPTFAGYLELEEGLRKELGRDIDLVTEGAVNKFLRPYIENDLKLIYGER